MRINEAYEHEPILPYQSEESCPLNGCNKVSTQCVDVTASVILSPTAVMGSPTVTCQGNPTITCATNADGTMCTVTMTQKVCVSIPVRYGTTISTCDPTITCAESCIGCGGCGGKRNRVPAQFGGDLFVFAPRRNGVASLLKKRYTELDL